MEITTSGVDVKARSRVLREAVELLSSMRFAISLLTLICIASVIGTVVKQNEPFNNYVNQFGPFWAEVFQAVNLYAVYSAPWFLVILAFLVISTSLCIARNTPKILVDLRAYKEHVREQSLQAFHHRGDATLAGDSAAHLARVNALLAGGGWKARAQVREHGTMVAARKGTSNKIGYLAAHSAIVLICLGGLLDGDLIVRAQMAWQGKTPYAGGGLVGEVPAQHRLSASNPTFRANLFVPEGARAGVAVQNMPDGVVLQDLPFDVELKKFIVEYYATGMPKLFASEIVIHDRETGQAIPVTVKVNEPAFHRGIAIYQSSFDDGGSRVKLRGLPLAPGQPLQIEGTVGGSTELVTAAKDQKLTLEFGALRVINVENMGGPPQPGGTDVRAVDLVHSIESRLGNATKVVDKKALRNVGPSINYKLRDASGQAREFHNYMLPVELDGQRVFLLGLRDTPQENFRYLRVPADEQGQIDGWVRLRQALMDPELREKAARRYVAQASPADKPEMAEQLLVTTRRALDLFAGVEGGTQGQPPAGGLPGLSQFIESNVPAADRERIAEVLLRIVNGSLFELANLSRELSGLAKMPLGAATEAFMTQAVLALSDSFLYPAPLVFQLADFKQVQASVFQVARAPGKNLVYLGAVLLIVGVFMMLYVRERRLWIWLQPDAADPSRTRVVTALSTTRRTLDADAEFDTLKNALLQDAR
jgi:cytochrome c biogenesis protein